MGIEVDEDQRPPHTDRKGDQGIVVRVEIGFILRRRGRAQRAIKVVRPGVIVALQRLSASTFSKHKLGTAMAADVDKGVNRAVLVASQYQWNIAYARSEEAARLVKLFCETGELPGVTKYTRLLRREYRWIGIPCSWQRIAPFQRFFQAGMRG